MAAVLSGSRVGVSRMATGRPHEEQKRTFSEDTAPQPEQVTMRTDCIAPQTLAAHSGNFIATGMVEIIGGIGVRGESSRRRLVRGDRGRARGRQCTGFYARAILRDRNTQAVRGAQRDADYGLPAGSGISRGQGWIRLYRGGMVIIKTASPPTVCIVLPEW
jgi:hypothetical protein